MFGKRRAGREAASGQEAMEAAGDYLLAGIVADSAAVDDAASRVDPLMLQAAVIDIAQRAVSALAEERGVDAEDVIRSLTGNNQQLR